jgi:uncharacterized protein (DUF305 family)
MMKKISLLLCLLLCTSLAPVSEKMTDLQMEISYLLNKRESLISKTSTELHQEVNSELASMNKMLDFRWGDFVSKLKNAQKYEKMNREDHEELHRIDLRLSQLTAEAQHLIQVR